MDNELKTFRVAVIAGTPVDTGMGVEFIEKMNSLRMSQLSRTHKYEQHCQKQFYVAQPVFLPVSDDCDAQIRFQYSGDSAKRARIDEIFDPAIADGIGDFFIYCNSLSGAFDFDSYAEEKKVRIYTPLQIYRSLGRAYHRLGLIAANNLSAYNIEKNLMIGRGNIYVIGSGNMAIVNAIEQGLAPEDIIDKLGLLHMVSYMEACGCEALLLGCTHFPYLKEALQPHCSIPLVDPAEEMFAAMMRSRI